MSKIAIDLGHGIGQDRGASGIIYEEAVIKDVGNRVINKLRALGHQIVETRPGSAGTLNDSLQKRVATANNADVDLFVSIHANATPGGYGTEIYTYNAQQFTQAKNVLRNICALGFANRGIKASNNVAYVVNHTRARAMLIEMFFVDSQRDVNLYNKIGAETIADAIVKGLVGTTISVNQQSETKISTHLRDWQSAYNNSYGKNITVDGIRGPQTEQAMSRAVIKYGHTNGLVGWLQCRIGASVDNIFGNRTKNALINYQRQNGLTPDGIAGYNTWNSLLNKFNW